MLLVSVGGLVFALRLRRKAPAASLWAAAGFTLGICASVLAGVGRAVQSDVAVLFVGPALWAIAWVLLLAGVYSGRRDPSAMPTGSAESLWQAVGRAVRAQPGLSSVSFVLFAGVFVVIALSTTLVTFIMPESFVAKARIVLRSAEPANATEASSPQAAPGGSGAREVATQCEIIQSELILGQVIQDLDLNRLWGIQYASGDRLKTSETMALVRGRIDVLPVTNTRLIEIASYSNKPEEAAKIANAIAEAYRDRSSQADAAASGVGIQRVEIVDRAVPPYRPVRPNKPLNITFGLLLGLVLGVVAGSSVWWAGLAMGKKQPATLQPA